MGDGIARVYGLDSFMTSALLEFTATLELDLETSYVGVVLAVMNTNLNKSIPVSSGYAGRCMNALGAPTDGMSDFRCLELSANGITAIDAIIEMDPELIIGSRDTAKSAVAIDRIIDQDACY